MSAMQGYQAAGVTNQAAGVTIDKHVHASSALLFQEVTAPPSCDNIRLRGKASSLDGLESGTLQNSLRGLLYLEGELRPKFSGLEGEGQL